MNIKRYRSEILAFGQLIINELDEPERYNASITSDELGKYFGIYDTVRCDTLYALREPTYHDLLRAVQFVWNMYVFMRRGF